MNNHVAISLLAGTIVGVTVGYLAFHEPEKVDPFTKYRDIQLTKGERIDSIKAELGEPDAYSEYWVERANSIPGNRLTSYDGVQTERFQHLYQELSYGAFGAHNQVRGHMTKHRLTLHFSDGKLFNWTKSAPIE